MDDGKQPNRPSARLKLRAAYLATGFVLARSLEIQWRQVQSALGREARVLTTFDRVFHVSESKQGGSRTGTISVWSWAASFGCCSFGRARMQFGVLSRFQPYTPAAGSIVESRKMPVLAFVLGVIREQVSIWKTDSRDEVQFLVGKLNRAE